MGPLHSPAWDGIVTRFRYTIDTTPGLINLATLDWNGWPTVAGSDYANPSASGLPDYDFTPTYTGVGGTINFPSMSVGFEPIQIVVTNNGAQEFDSDSLRAIISDKWAVHGQYEGRASWVDGKYSDGQLYD